MFLQYGVQNYSFKIQKLEFDITDFSVGGMSFYFVAFGLSSIIFYYFVQEYSSLILMSAYKLNRMKKEYQNVLGHLDEAIIWQ